jgi:GNAT superfamily N-acetyltransferase
VDVVWEIEEAIAALVERMRERDAQCFWAVGPSSTPADLPQRLREHGLQVVEPMTCMSLELSDWTAPAQALPHAVTVEAVVDDAGMEDYIGLAMRYWEIPEDEQTLVAELHRYWAPGLAPGQRYLARADGTPIGKAYLSLAGPPGVACVWGMSVLPEARGRGVAQALTTTLLQEAKDRGCRRIVLHSTEMGFPVYRKAGFVERCPLTFFATASLWAGEH